MIQWSESMTQAEWEQMLQEREALYDKELTELIEKFGISCPTCGLYISHCRRSKDSGCSQPDYRSQLEGMKQRMGNLT